jgi:hypothetical protein
MLKAAASQRYKHDKALKHKPSNMKDWQHANQLKKLPDIISKRIANMELRRQFLEGQNIRNRSQREDETEQPYTEPQCRVSAGSEVSGTHQRTG